MKRAIDVTRKKRQAPEKSTSNPASLICWAHTLQCLSIARRCVVRHYDAVPDPNFLVRFPLEKYHLLRNEIAQGQVGLIGGRGTPRLHHMTTRKQPADLVMEGALCPAAGQVVPNGDPHLHEP